MYGASTQELRAAAAQLRTEAEQLNSSAAALTRDLGALTWLGTLAVRFSDVWNSHHHSQMMVTAAFLNENADKLFRHAEQQDRASEGSSGSPIVVHPPSMGRGFPGGPPLLGGAGRPEPLPTEPRPFVPHGPDPLPTEPRPFVPHGPDPLPGIPPRFSDPVEPLPFRPDHHTDPGFEIPDLKLAPIPTVPEGPHVPDVRIDPGYDRITDPKLPFDPKHDPMYSAVMPEREGQNPGYRITDPKLPFDPKHDPIVAVPVMPTPPLRPNPHDQNRP